MVHQRVNILNGRHKAADLPKYYYDDKRRKRPHISWAIQTSIPIPGSTQSPKLWIPNFHRLHQTIVARHGQKRGAVLILCFYLAIFFLLFGFSKRFMSRRRAWPGIGASPTLVFKREDLMRIWLWEIDSGHYPTRRESTSLSVSIIILLTDCTSPKAAWL